MRGGLEQRRTFHDLHELISKGDGIDQAMSGVLPDGIIQDGAQVQMAGTVAMMREMGIRGDVIREALTGYEPSQALIDETTRYKADLMSNPEWRKKFMSGDVEARRQKFLANSILTDGIREQA